MIDRVTCLIVDDLDENLLALAALLRRPDVEVLQARSGPEALELLLVHDVALALLDVQMPGMDGFELAELMRGSERTRHVPLIFVTAGAHESHRVFKGYESGAVDFLHKPIEPRVLLSKAEVFFELARQRRQLASDLHERSETLRLNEMFVAMLGHDLRTPLSAMLGSAALLQRALPEGKLRDSASRMMSSGRRMADMIDAMLDLTRARLSGGLQLVRTRLDPIKVLQQVVSEQRAICGQREIEAVFEDDLVGEWDGERLARLASNLIGNAVAHGAPEMPVRVRLDGDAAGLRLAVTNGGVIPQELRGSLFDAFRSAERNGGRNDGLGLGLYIVDQIVRAHPGTIEVDSEDGTTEFRIWLPRHPAPVAP
ncbi:MAG: hybrid sensor histidine kinase/response regulator [Burkholderiaceae bacterium]